MIASTHALDLGPAARASLDRRAWRRREPVAAPALAALLAKHGYAATPAVTAFEAAYGGIEFSDAGESIADEMGWVIGAGACVSSGAHGAPRGAAGQAALGLVPVAFSPNDIIYYLDRDGRGWAHDTIEDPEAMPFAPTGPMLVTRLLLYGDVFSAHPREQLEGIHGARLAALLDLAPLAEASDAREQWWTRGHVLLVESGGSGPGQPRHTILANAKLPR